MANSPSGESVINRVVRILESFDQSSPELGLRELSRIVDLPVSTVHRLLNELEAEGLVTQDNDAKWTHGIRLWEVASRGARTSDLRQAALPSMEDLVQGTGVNVSLGVQDGTDVLYLERLVADDDVHNITEIAGRIPVHACSAGLVITAFSDRAAQDLLLQRQLRKYTNDTVTDPRELRQLLATIRHEGYAAMSGIIVSDASGIAVPIFGADGDAIAALSVIVHRGEENISLLVPQLHFAARAIMRRIGVLPTPRQIHRTSLQP